MEEKGTVTIPLQLTTKKMIAFLPNLTKKHANTDSSNILFYNSLKIWDGTSNQKLR